MIINQLKLMKMSCYKYWGKLEEIANKLSKYKNKGDCITNRLHIF